MSVKYFCDQCGVEIDPADLKRIKRKRDKVMVEVMVGVGMTWNGGHVCRKCVIKTVTEGRDMNEHEYNRSKECDDD